MATVHNIKGKPAAPSAGAQRRRARGLGKLADIASGASGPEVEDLQRALVLAGYRVAVTGNFDTPTQTAVIDAQRVAGLPTTGIVDDATQNAILDRSEGSSVPNPGGQVIVGDPITITGNVPKAAPFFLFDPNVALWKKALAVGGGLAVIGVVLELMSKAAHGSEGRAAHTLTGYEKALNSPPRCRGKPPAAVDLEDAEVLEAEG